MLKYATGIFLNARTTLGLPGKIGNANTKPHYRSSEAIIMLALPIFPGSHPPSIVGVHELNFCVRDGNRWTLMTINTNSNCSYNLIAFEL